MHSTGWWQSCWTNWRELVCTLDLHANVSELMATQASALIA